MKTAGDGLDGVLIGGHLLRLGDDPLVGDLLEHDGIGPGLGDAERLDLILRYGEDLGRGRSCRSLRPWGAC